MRLKDAVVSKLTDMQARLERIDASEILAKIRADLAYRLPQSGKPLGMIVLSRQEAEKLIEDIAK
jgi:hypothetical protein